MKTFPIFFITFALTATFALAGNGSINPGQTTRNIGKDVQVAGKVDSVVAMYKGTYLKFSHKPHGFTVVIPSSTRGQFDNPYKYTGQQVAVTGRVEKNEFGDPQITVTSPKQISVVK
ncbi:MAG: hypothetical protein ABIP97_10045 [Chthoniobacterales bacterium]